MRINIVTLFPEFFDGPLTSALMKRAREAGIISFAFHNPRDAAADRHRTVDDRPYGGGPGMVMLAGPLASTLRGLGFSERGNPQPGRLIFLSPRGEPFTQAMAHALARIPARLLAQSPAHTPERSMSPDFFCPHKREPEVREPAGESTSFPSFSESSLTLICGRYEGMDARIEEIFPVECVSVGDFVLNGGEAAALCLIEAVARLLPGFMGHEDSGADESFSCGLLEYPHYTRPEEFEGRCVPDVLRGGDHGRIAVWRREAALEVTLRNRPDLLTQAALSEDDHAFLEQCETERHGRNLYCALVHYPVLDKQKNSVAVSLTNLDIHDIARSSCTYGLGGYYVVTPLRDQLDLLHSLVGHWRSGPGRQSNPDRDRALGLVSGVTSLQEAVAEVAARTGQEPLVVGTAAGNAGGKLPVMGFLHISEALRTRPVLLLFGTGHGLSPEAHPLCHAFAPPVRRHGGYNHLSVRSAVAIVLDRILGDWQ